MIDLGVSPCPRLNISMPRQEQIIAAITRRLTANTLQGFLFHGSPNCGKSHLLDAIRRAVLRHIASVNEAQQDIRIDPVCPRVVTLAEWAGANVDRSRGNSVSDTFNSLTVKGIWDIVEKNGHSRYWAKPECQTLHIFMDEIDRMPTVSEFGMGNFEDFINAAYCNSPRFYPGNSSEYVQLCCAMNQTWEEFEEAYGTHLARRLLEMCVVIDFDKDVITEPIASPTPPARPKVDSTDAAHQCSHRRTIHLRQHAP